MDGDEFDGTSGHETVFVKEYWRSKAGMNMIIPAFRDSNCDKPFQKIPEYSVSK
jgi:hypothetical protein